MKTLLNYNINKMSKFKMETNMKGMNKFRKNCQSITEIRNSHQMYHFSSNGLSDLIFL